jgi:hypothetical protein
MRSAARLGIGHYSLFVGDGFEWQLPRQHGHLGTLRNIWSKPNKNKVHGFSTGRSVIFTLRSVLSCQILPRKSLKMVGAVGIEPTTSPV